MNYSYKGIEWNGDRPLIEHIKDGYKTSKIYRINKYPYENFDLVWMYELKNLTNQYLVVIIEYRFLDKDNIEIDTINDGNTPRKIVNLKPKEQIIVDMKLPKQKYGNFSISKSDWEVTIYPLEKEYYKEEPSQILIPFGNYELRKTYSKKSGLW